MHVPENQGLQEQITNLQLSLKLLENQTIPHLQEQIDVLRVEQDQQWRRKNLVRLTFSEREFLRGLVTQNAKDMHASSFQHYMHILYTV